MSFSVPINEQETIINISRDEQGCEVWTSDSTMMTKLDRMVAKSDHYSIHREDFVRGSLVAKEYRIDDKSLISFRAKRVSMELSDEQKKARAARLRGDIEN